MLFEQLLIYEDRAPVSAAMNMAIDEALLEHCDLPGFALLWLARAVAFLRLLRQICRISPAETKDRESRKALDGWRQRSPWPGPDLLAHYAGK